MEIRFVMTPEEYGEGYRAMLRSSTLPYQIYAWLYSWPSMVIGVCFIGIGVWTLSFGGNQGFFPGIAVIAGGVVLIAMPLRFRIMIRKLHRLQDLSREFTVTVDANGVHAKRAMRDAETRFGWSAIERSGESKHLILLFPTKVQFFPIPRRALAPGQADELRALIAANVGQRPAVAGR